jgi:hypothetical protein
MEKMKLLGREKKSYE